MFRKEHIESLLDEVKRDYGGKAEFEQLNRDAHLAIAQFDADRSLGKDIDSRVVALIEKHKPEK